MAVAVKYINQMVEAILQHVNVETAARILDDLRQTAGAEHNKSFDETLRRIQDGVDTVTVVEQGGVVEVTWPTTRRQKKKLGRVGWRP